MRGCSRLAPALPRTAVLFPAYAGLFRESRVRASPLIAIPRIRGVVPWITVNLGEPRALSSHTRGCSATPHTPQGQGEAFPVYAGLFQSSALALHNPLDFSSRMRGCSRSRKLESFFLTFPRMRGVDPPRLGPSVDKYAALTTQVGLILGLLLQQFLV